MVRYQDTKYLISSSGLVVNENTGRAINPQDNGRGYKKVTLSINGVQPQRYIHRLVAEMYVPNPNGFKQVNHKDGDKANNHFTNLEWIDGLGNIRHAIKNGLFPKSTDYWSSKLTEKDIKVILKMHRSGITQRKIAKKYKVSYATICETVNGKRHKALTGQELTFKS